MNSYFNILLFVALATLIDSTCVPMSFNTNPVQGNSQAVTENSNDDVTGLPCTIGYQEVHLKTDNGFHLDIHFDYAQNLIINQANISIFDGPEAIGTPFCVVTDDTKIFKCAESSSTNEITLAYYIKHPIYSFLPQFTIAAKSLKSRK
uniref:Uncharacterized protein n=1 Tax=Rhabditophanes sp. KR3021 TaxID=114890 RepID=A0AC35U438_9BILA